ncbi:MAG: 50S ribosomal protein L3 [Eubacteriales bacterium]|nr:50S ribosomal protein L3 [Eubacteriales bacterium]
MREMILGKKIGMTQIFDAEGKLIPVTVVEAGPCIVVQQKDTENDGYQAVKVGYGGIKEKNANKPHKGQFAKAGITPLRYLREVKVDDLSKYPLGHEIKADVFRPGDMVDVTGVSKGKGTQGVIKRHNFSRGPMAHGSRHHRKPGSIGALGPNRVFKGKKLPGHMGRDKITVQGLEIVKVDAEKNLLLIKGSVPGARKTLITIKKSVKS